MQRSGQAQGEFGPGLQQVEVVGYMDGGHIDEHLLRIDHVHLHTALNQELDHVGDDRIQPVRDDADSHPEYPARASTGASRSVTQRQ